MKARYEGRCGLCSKPIAVGQELDRHDRSWGHEECVRAVLTDGRERSRILDGVAFAGHQPSAWRVGVSPSGAGRGRYTGGRRRGHTRGIRKVT